MKGIIMERKGKTLTMSVFARRKKQGKKIVLLTAYDLTENELKEFDYLEEGEGSFFRYKGEVYDLGEFMAWDNPASPTRGDWDGCRGDSYFSGLVVKYDECCEMVKVGLYLS